MIFYQIKSLRLPDNPGILKGNIKFQTESQYQYEEILHDISN